MGISHIPIFRNWLLKPAANCTQWLMSLEHLWLVMV